MSFTFLRNRRITPEFAGAGFVGALSAFLGNRITSESAGDVCVGSLSEICKHEKYTFINTK